MLTIRLTTCDGQQFQLPLLLRWELTYTGGVPCDCMAATCLYAPEMAEVLPKATRFQALQNGKVMLNGVLDAWEVSLSGQGLVATVEGRGMCALLLDNEAEAITYEHALLEDILDNHVQPYGIETDLQLSPEGGKYTVSSGSSQWRALRGFTHRYGGFDPYFTPGGVLVTAPLWGSGRTLTVNDDTPILALQYRNQRCGVISEVLIQDKVQGVSHSVKNRPFLNLGGQRRHVLYMPRSTADDRRYTGEYQIAQSALEQWDVSLELPTAFAAFPGDRIALRHQRLGIDRTLDVVEARSRMDAQGGRTELLLSER